MTIGYQAYQPTYRPGGAGVPGWAAPRVPGLPAASLPSLSQVAEVARDRPHLLGAAVSGGIAVVLFGWAVALGGVQAATAEPGDSPAPVVVPAGVAPPPAAPGAPIQAPVPAPAPAPAPAAPPAPVVPAPAPVPEIITFDTGDSGGAGSGGAVGCFPFQPC
ncbi:hypothetical protein [Nocardia carnea]|uniref:hypothetical protein n=1 Tax=Nocardia carnea TaxID=37328 RepID=UPI00245764F6|nr:hypothetical protein [Nocardia carnea]